MELGLNPIYEISTRVTPEVAFLQLTPAKLPCKFSCRCRLTETMKGAVWPFYEAELVPSKFGGVEISLKAIPAQPSTCPNCDKQAAEATAAPQPPPQPPQSPRPPTPRPPSPLPSTSTAPVPPPATLPLLKNQKKRVKGKKTPTPPMPSPISLSPILEEFEIPNYDAPVRKRAKKQRTGKPPHLHPQVSSASSTSSAPQSVSSAPPPSPPPPDTSFSAVLNEDVSVNVNMNMPELSNISDL